MSSLDKEFVDATRVIEDDNDTIENASNIKNYNFLENSWDILVENNIGDERNPDDLEGSPLEPLSITLIRSKNKKKKSSLLVDISPDLRLAIL